MGSEETCQEFVLFVFCGVNSLNNLHKWAVKKHCTTEALHFNKKVVAMFGLICKQLYNWTICDTESSQ
jgi:hypothetical protein